MTLPPELHHVPENELALQQIIGMPEGSFAVIQWPGTGREGNNSYPAIMKMLIFGEAILAMFSPFCDK